ncbi:MAG: glycosyltransferase family 39 protein [Bacteroidota bacterium]|nr:glycosyltransferase family 39 protein [Bacteroidota bacterium]
MKYNKSLLYILAVVKFALPFLLQSPYYQPHRDEFLYLAEGNHLAWGFLEVPPLLSLMAWCTHALGDGLFWIKFWPSLFGALTFILTGEIVLLLGGSLFALLLAFLPFIFGAYLRVHYLFQPNFLEIFFYTLIAYAIVQYIINPKNKWLYLFGVACGLGMLSKYSVAFFIIGVMVGLLVSQHRKIFLSKHLYFAAAIALCLFLPNLLWQYNHHFPVAHHMKELQETQLQFISPIDFLKDQLLMNLPCVFIWITGLLFIILTKKGRRFIVFFWAYATVIALLLFFHGKNYYALGLYPFLFAFGAYQLERLTVKRVRIMRYVFITVAFYFGVLFVPVLLPVLDPPALVELYHKRGWDETDMLKWEDQKQHALPQDFADMMGWKEIAEKTAAVYNGLPDEEKNKTIIKCSDYGLCGALNFYGKLLGLPEVYSYNGDFLNWMPTQLNVSNVITVGESVPDTARPIIKQFSTILVKDELRDSLARENGTKVILLEHANSRVLSSFLEEEITEKKKALLP